MESINILFVNGIDNCLGLERTFLGREQFRLIAVRTGCEALHFVQEHDVPLVFLDHHVADMPPLECLRLLKSAPSGGGSLPAVIVTGNPGGKTADNYRVAGCDALLPKPVDLHTFLETVRRFLLLKERRAPRYLLQVPARLHLESEEELLCHSINVSTGGVFLHVDRMLPVETLLDIRLELPDGYPIDSLARVAWVNHPEFLKKADLPPGIGLQFLEVGTEARAAIAGCIRKKRCTPVYGSLLRYEEPEAAPLPPSVLLVDPSHRARHRLREILAPENLRLREAETASEALTSAFADPPDLIIVSGVAETEELVRELHSKSECSDVPVICVSGLSISIGGDFDGGGTRVEVLPRPLAPPRVLARVRACLEAHHLSRALVEVRQQLRESEHETKKSLEAAALIQQSLLPISLPDIASFDFAWRFIPCHGVGGDLFNIFRLDEHHLGAYVMDVSGHGFPAAMIATSVAQSFDVSQRNILKRSIERPPFYEIVSPVEVVTRLNREYPIERFEKFITICYFVIDTAGGEIRYSNAAHPPPLLLRPDGSFDRLTEGGTIIGIGDEAAYTEGRCRIETGDRLFLYTDGILEYVDAAGEFFGEERLLAELRADPQDTLQMACTRVMNSLITFGNGRRPEDDITLVGIRYG